jgi:hypothetical protein
MTNAHVKTRTLCKAVMHDRYYSDRTYNLAAALLALLDGGLNANECERLAQALLDFDRHEHGQPEGALYDCANPDHYRQQANFILAHLAGTEVY